MHALAERLQEALGGEFEVGRKLGDGSVAEVFLAREKALDRPVAVKVLRADLALDDTARKRFLREARLAAKIHHRNVVAVHRVGELDEGGRPYLMMEYIDGRTFDDILAATGPLEEDEVRRIVVEVCGALEAAHRLGIIHRDVRPGNIMRTRDGERILLTDFGLAGILEVGGEAVTRLTGAGQILGNVRYAPPEQLSGETVQPGSDLYALAVTAYELLSGEGPFPGRSRPAELIQGHLKEEPARLRELRPDVSQALDEILLRCLNKRPEQRPSAAALAERLTAPSAAPAAHGVVGSFLAELKRRHVYKVGAAYGAFLLVVLALVDAALPALPGLPEWLDTAIVTAALAGLPLALVLGWFFDLTASGVRRTPTDGARDTRELRLLQVGAFALTLLVAAVLGWVFLAR